MKKSTLMIRNIFVSIISKVALLAFGFIVPRIIITAYGSDMNGLLGTVTQIFSYMALLQAGIGQATLNMLYKPIANGDKEEVSLIMSSSRAYFRKATLIYICFFVCLSIIFPFIVNTSLDYKTVFFIVFFEGASEIISYMYIQCRNELLYAEGKSYISVSVDTILKIATYFFKIVLAVQGINIVIIQMIYFLLNLLKYLFYKLYFRKYYNWVDFTRKPNINLLKERKSFVLIELSWTVFLSTDMIILSMFCDTKLASVYSIYNLVFANIGNILGAVFSGTSYLLGVEYSKNINKYKKLHDMYTLIFMTLITILMSVAYIMMDSFIKLYTVGVTDINYSYEMLAMLFALVQMISWSRYVNGILTGIAGYAKLMSGISIIEAVLNIVVSLIAVGKFGIIGVVLGTVVALPIKFIVGNYIVDKKILCRNQWKTYYTVGLNFMLFFIVVIIGKSINLKIDNYFDFIIEGIKMVLGIGSAIVVINLMAHIKDVIYYVKRIKSR